MQITKSKDGGSHRRLLFACFCVALLVLIMFDFYNGGTSYDTYDAYAMKDTSPSGASPAEVQAAIAKALALNNAAPASSLAAVAMTRNDFKALGRKAGTDKIEGHLNLPKCLEDRTKCLYPDNENERCRPWGHFYDTIYERWLAPYTSGHNPMQLLEIGYYRGNGFEAYTNFLSNNPAAELHSMEISCLEPGPRKEGKWPFGNTADKHKWYKDLRGHNRLHCGDASDYDFLVNTWTKMMKRPDAPPLKVVIDDGSHLTHHMAASLFFWFPRIEPGGILVVEDIQPIEGPNKFRTHFLPMVMKDLHWCGGTSNFGEPDSLCLPTIQPFLMGVHCEFHICVFQRNDKPAIEPDKAGSLTPKIAETNGIPNCLFGPHK